MMKSLSYFTSKAVFSYCYKIIQIFSYSTESPCFCLNINQFLVEIFHGRKLLHWCFCDGVTDA